MSDRKLELEEFSKAEKLRYLMQTPFSLFFLTVDGTLPRDISQKILAQSFMLKLMSLQDIGTNKSRDLLGNLVNIAANLKRACDFLKECSQEASEVTAEYFKKCSEEIGIISTLDLSDQFLNWFEKAKEHIRIVPPNDCYQCVQAVLNKIKAVIAIHK